MTLEAAVDVERFEAAAREARGTADPAAHERALELYAGELLPEDRYEPWTAARRVALRELHTTLCLELARAGRAGDAARRSSRSSRRSPPTRSPSARSAR